MNARVAMASPRRRQQEDAPTTTEEVPRTFSETAWDWYQRSQRRKAAQRRDADLPPTSPASAAWAFFRASAFGGTGIPFVDASLKRGRNRGSLPALELRDVMGDTGKTRILTALAARFVVATRPSLFPTTDSNVVRHATLPRVIFCDSTLDVTALQLAHTVSAQLLRSSDTLMMTNLEDDIVECLNRIHVAQVDDIQDWLPFLERLRSEFSHCNSAEEDVGGLEDIPILLLWDGFLSEPGNTRGMQKEITRQLARLLRDCTIGLIYTRTARSSLDSSHFLVPPVEGSLRGKGNVPQAVVLERDESEDRRHDFKATVVLGNQQIPYSLSMTDVLG